MEIALTVLEFRSVVKLVSECNADIEDGNYIHLHHEPGWRELWKLGQVNKKCNYRAYHGAEVAGITPLTTTALEEGRVSKLAEISAFRWHTAWFPGCQHQKPAMRKMGRTLECPLQTLMSKMAAEEKSACSPSQVASWKIKVQWHRFCHYFSWILD